jgi:hypothetical protein
MLRGIIVAGDDDQVGRLLGLLADALTTRPQS